MFSMIVAEKIIKILCSKILLIRPGPGGYKTFLCSTQLSMKFILLMNVKMPISVGILTLLTF